MAHDIRVVFMDIDGTIVSRGKLVPSAVEAVNQLQAQGLQVVLCTGRSVLHTKDIQSQLHVTYGVYFNGGLVKERDQIISSSPLAESVVLRIASYFLEKDLPVIFHSKSDALSLMPIPAQFDPLLAEYDYPPIERISQVKDLQSGIDIFQTNVFMEKTWDQTVQNEFPECLIYRWADNAVDLQKRGCDKSVGARVLLKHLNVSAEQAVHIGDGGNDIGMFQAMGMSIAMGNATSEVKRYAQMVTSHVEEDGVYRAFQSIGLL